MSSASPGALLYEEPGIRTVLVLSSFIFLLNAVNHLLDSVIYCGLLGQVLLGIAWGTPGAQWLDEPSEKMISDLGYLGLILLVYEGGLSTSMASLQSNLALSVTIALTGIALPIALSFSLQSLVGASSLQAFAAGAALCSTSLGTTFTVLKASNLIKTRLGVVLTSAAMMDDVVGLVMVKIITNLGDSTSFSAATVIRPIGVSFAFILLVPTGCAYLVKPIGFRLLSYSTSTSSHVVKLVCDSKEVTVAAHLLTLFAFVAASTYAGTSNLFAAYLAGAAISWWDKERISFREQTRIRNEQRAGVVPGEELPCTEDERAASPQPEETSNIREAELASNKSTASSDFTTTTGTEVFESHFKQPVDHILKPFFFASIGFSIPISRMFDGEIVWRGFVYATLMTIGKLACGIWLIRLSISFAPLWNWLARSRFELSSHIWLFQKKTKSTPKESSNIPGATTDNASSSHEHADRSNRPSERAIVAASRKTASKPHNPLSLYPSGILGLAMVARGEIGFLVSSIAQSNGIFSNASTSGSQELFLVVTWAILLCTMLGPIGVGLLVRRVRRLERQKTGKVSEPLGVWGVD